MFSWSTNSTSSSNTATRTQSTMAPTYPAVRGSIRPPEFTRQQHLDSYLDDETLKRSTRKVSTDDSTYDTVFQTVSGATLILRVHMPPLVHPNAPIRRPQMTLAGLRARHSWLDDHMQVVGYSPIQSDDQWRSSRLLLGAAVHQVVQQLQVHPPEILEITDRGLKSIQKNANSTTGSHSHSHNGEDNHQRQSLPSTSAAQPSAVTAHRKSTSQASRSNDAPPDYHSSFSSQPVDAVQLPRQFDEIESLSPSRVQELLDDELEFMAFCHSLPTLRRIRSKAQEQFEANFATAKSHLSQKETLESLTKEVSGLREQLQRKVAAFKTLQERQDAFLAPPDETIAIRQLALEKKQALQESERLAELWLEQGAPEPVAFVKEFVERRKQHHLAAAKMELLQMQPKR